jgi:hypothetical protein
MENSNRNEKSFDPLGDWRPEWVRRIEGSAPNMAAGLWAWYSALLTAGFDKEQAMTLLLAQFYPRGKRAPNE